MCGTQMIGVPWPGWENISGLNPVGCVSGFRPCRVPLMKRQVPPTVHTVGGTWYRAALRGRLVAFSFEDVGNTVVVFVQFFFFSDCLVVLITA